MVRKVIWGILFIVIAIYVSLWWHSFWIENRKYHQWCGNPPVHGCLNKY
jgi:hypothetical protein